MEKKRHAYRERYCGPVLSQEPVCLYNEHAASAPCEPGNHNIQQSITLMTK